MNPLPLPHAVVICPVLPYPPTGGAEKRTLRLLEAMERSGVTPHIVTADGARASGAEALRARGWQVDIVRAPPPSFAARLSQHAARRPSPYLAGVAARLRELRASAPAFVQVEHAMSAYYASAHPASRSVLSTHNVDAEMLRTIAAGRRLGGERLRWRVRAAATAVVERRAARASDRVLCVSDSDAEHFRRLGGDVLVVPNGVDDELFDVPAATRTGEDLLFFGNLAYEPNRQGLRRFLLEGWPRVVAAHPRVRLRVCGPGTDDDLRRVAAGSERVELLGVVADLAAVLCASRLVLVPIWHGGGTRIKVLEALAAARPVVGTGFGVSGIGFVDGRHGVLADTPEGLADAASALLGDADRCAELAHAGRTLAGGFRWPHVTEPAAELYARWAAGG